MLDRPKLWFLKIIIKWVLLLDGWMLCAREDCLSISIPLSDECLISQKWFFKIKLILLWNFKWVCG
jgi:hypothetical protein